MPQRPQHNRSFLPAISHPRFSRREVLQYGLQGGAALGALHRGISTSHAAPADVRFRPSPAGTPHHDDRHLYLFFDDDDIERSSNLRRFLNPPRRYAKPVVVSDRPWEGEDRVQAWGSVIQEPDGLLRMWYFAFNTERVAGESDRGGYCYAESRDGFHWEKPDLGVVEFRGSKKNNLFYSFNPSRCNLHETALAQQGIGLPALDINGQRIGILNNADGLTVVRDDDDPDPEKRYKLIANMQDHRMWKDANPKHYRNVTEAEKQQAWSVFGQYLDTSPDGIHWAHRPQRTAGAIADYMLVTRDHRNRRWWLNERSKRNRDPRAQGRNAALRTGDDLIHWSQPEIIFDNLADSDFGKLWEWHGGISPFNYGQLNLGFLERWPNVGFSDTCELVFQRPGKPWQRIAPDHPFITTGPEGSFDRQMAYPTHNPPWRVGNKLHIYYTGASATEAQSGRRDMDMAIGVMTIGLDRFVGLANRRRAPGSLLTRPLVIERDQLEVNAEPLMRGRLKVAVLTPDEKLIPGFGHEHCTLQEMKPGKTRYRIRWTDHADLSSLRGQTIRLLFYIESTVVYGYRFSDPSGHE